jgi:D-glycero-alpha-D-manno-heptose-7-phosphate kinase
LDAREELDDIPGLSLQIGVYNHIVKNFSKKPLSFELITEIDVPTGSGLGTSSTIAVSILGVFMEWLKLPFGEYDVAQRALTIERKELQMAGGKQDQYAATFGGFNYMEFYENERVIVNPLRIKPYLKKELNYHLLLFHTQTKRESSNIIEKQTDNFKNELPNVLEASHNLKEIAVKMKEALLIGELTDIGELLNMSWENKKVLADDISNPEIENIYSTAMNAGAIGGKISGAGGGGFMIFYCPNDSRFNVIDDLEAIGVQHQNYNFQNKGLETWTSQQ